MSMKIINELGIKLRHDMPLYMLNKFPAWWEFYTYNNEQIVKMFQTTNEGNYIVTTVKHKYIVANEYEVCYLIKENTMNENKAITVYDVYNYISVMQFNNYTYNGEELYHIFKITETQYVIYTTEKTYSNVAYNELLYLKENTMTENTLNSQKQLWKVSITTGDNQDKSNYETDEYIVHTSSAVDAIAKACDLNSRSLDVISIECELFFDLVGGQIYQEL